jgi:hypothetical protein
MFFYFFFCKDEGLLIDTLSHSHKCLNKVYTQTDVLHNIEYVQYIVSRIEHTRYGIGIDIYYI